MTNIFNKVLITKDGLDALKKELKILDEEKRPRAVERMALAREQGDLSENSEYKAATEDLSFIEGRITELREIIARSKLIQGNKNKGLVDLGSSVTVHIEGKKDIYTIVGEWEADPKQKKISHSSPLGQALLGKKVGEKVEVEAPAGKVVYKILSIK